jgi:Uma2 family endonuclease
MEEYLANGARMGWLLDPMEPRVYIYRAGTTCDQVDELDAIAGDPLLPGFTLQLAPVRESRF